VTTKSLPDIRVLNDGELKYNAVAKAIHELGDRAPIDLRRKLRELVYSAHVLGVLRAHPNVMSFTLMFACVFEVQGEENIPRITGQAWPARVLNAEPGESWPKKNSNLLHPDDALELYHSIFGDGMYGHPSQWEKVFERSTFDFILKNNVVKASTALEFFESNVIDY
jgi:hypothetical protein